jgi:hypothetical protein
LYTSPGTTQEVSEALMLAKLPPDASIAESRRGVDCVLYVFRSPTLETALGGLTAMGALYVPVSSEPSERMYVDAILTAEDPVLDFKC